MASGLRKPSIFRSIVALLVAVSCFAGDPITWEQALNRELRWTNLFERPNWEMAIYLNEIPIDEWLDPELHRYLRRMLLKSSKDRHEIPGLSSRLGWALSRKPELLKEWFPEGNPENRAVVFRFTHWLQGKLNASPEYGAIVRKYRSETVVGVLDRWMDDPVKGFIALQDADVDFALQQYPEGRAFLAKRMLQLRPAEQGPVFGKVASSYPSLFREVLTQDIEAAVFLRAPHDARIIRSLPELRMQILQRFMSDRKRLSAVWFEYPDTAMALRELVIQKGIRGSSIEPEVLVDPAASTWIQSFPEDWVEAKLGAASNGFSEAEEDFFVAYARARPRLRAKVKAAFPDRVLEIPTDLDALYNAKDFLFELPSRDVFDKTAKSPSVLHARYPVPDYRIERSWERRADFEDRGRLALEEDRILYRGLDDLTGGSYGDDQNFRNELNQGAEFFEKSLARGRETLKRQGIETNPIEALQKSLELFLNNQVRFEPKMKPLPQHVIDVRVREALENWPENPTDPMAQWVRSEHEKRLRRRLGFEEAPSKEKVKSKRRAKVDPRAFRAWRRERLRRVEDQARETLRRLSTLADSHGILALPGLSPEAIESIRYDAAGGLVDALGVPVKIADITQELERGLVFDSVNQTPQALAEGIALARSHGDQLKSLQLAAKSLQRDGVRPDLLLNFYDYERRVHEQRQLAADRNRSVLEYYLWGKLTQDTNHWRKLRARAVAEKRPPAPFLSRRARGNLHEAGIIATAVVVFVGGIGGLVVGGAAFVDRFLAHESKSVEAGKGEGDRKGKILTGIARPNLKKAPPPPVMGSGEGEATALYRLRHFRQTKPNSYSVGFDDEFRAKVLETVDLKLAKPGHTWVQVDTAIPFSPSPEGLLVLPRPVGGELKRVELTSTDGTLKAGADYVVLRDPRTHDLAIRVLHEDAAEYGFSLSFDEAAAGSFEALEARNATAERSFDPVLKGKQLNNILKQMRTSGFVGLPLSMESYLGKNGDQVSTSALAEVFAADGIYSFRQPGSPKLGFFREWEQNPFLAYSGVLSNKGQYTGTCGPHNLLQAETLNAGYKAANLPYRAEVRASFSNRGGLDVLTGDQAHAQTYVYGDPSGVPIIVDATATTRDWNPAKGAKPRVDSLPTDHGSTENKRLKDLVDLLFAQFLARRREHEELLRFFADLEERRKAAAQPETAEEFVLRHQNEARIKAQQEEEAAKLARLKIEEALRKAAPAYEFLKRLEASKGESIKTGNALRRKGAHLPKGDPMRHATRLVGQTYELFAEAPEPGELQRRLQELQGEASRVHQQVDDLRVLKNLSEEYQERRARRSHMKLTEVEQEALRRTGINPSGEVPWYPSLDSDEVVSQLKRTFTLIADGLGALPDETLEALSVARQLAPEEHLKRLGTPPVAACLRSEVRSLAAGN